MNSPFHDQFVELFDTRYAALFRYLHRMCGDADVAADVAQETFVKLHRRGEMPDVPRAWLVTVAANLMRNALTTSRRRRWLTTEARAERVMADVPPSAAETVEGADTRDRVRASLNRLGEREQQMLLLRAEGHSYREIAVALGMHEASVGTLLARAKRAFRESYGEPDAP